MCVAVASEIGCTGVFECQPKYVGTFLAVLLLLCVADRSSKGREYEKRQFVHGCYVSSCKNTNFFGSISAISIRKNDKNHLSLKIGDFSTPSSRSR